MKAIRNLTLSLLFAGCLAGVVVAADDADAVVARYLEAVGGRDALEKVQTRIVKGTFSLPSMGMVAPFELYSQPPDKSYMLIEFDAVAPVSNGVVGDIAWQIDPMNGARVLKGPERAAALRQTDTDLFLDWRKHFTGAEVAGEEQIDGRAHTKVVFTPAEGTPLSCFFDSETHLMVRIDGTQNGLPMRSELSEYREVGGIKAPFKTRIMSSQYTFELEIESIEQNVEIPAEKFVLPAAIQSLVSQ